MSDSFILHLRSLCYGVMIAFFVITILRFIPAIKSEKSKHARYIMNMFVMALLLLVIKNVMRFVFDALNLADPNTISASLLKSTHILEMMAVPFLGVSLVTLVRLKPMRVSELPMILLPLFVSWAFYTATGIEVVYYMSLCYTLVYAAVVILTVHIYVKRYQKLLNETYANTTHRGVTWVLITLYIMVGLLALWLVLSFVNPGAVSDCIYFPLSLIPWVFYARRILRQNFNIEDMTNISYEDDIEEVHDKHVVEHESALKAWQEPKFGEAITTFCSDVNNFSNTDLSIVEVARAVGTNRTYVSRWCKEHGMDFSAYIAGIRLDYAEKLLSGTSHSISDIVTMSGFSNPRSFRLVFAARYNCTPSEYRAKNMSQSA